MKEQLPVSHHLSSFISPRVRIDAGANVGPNCYIDGDISIAKGAVLLGGITLIGTLEIGENCTLEPGVNTCSVAGVTIHRFKRIRDLRGDLSVGEFSRNVPFRPKRYFLVYDVPTAETRGEHAHRECQQFLTCVREG